jgi:hypothetical protein
MNLQTYFVPKPVYQLDAKNYPDCFLEHPIVMVDLAELNLNDKNVSQKSKFYYGLSNLGPPVNLTPTLTLIVKPVPVVKTRENVTLFSYQYDSLSRPR